LIRTIKSAVVALIGRPLANRLSGPYHAWQARRRSVDLLRRLPAQGLRVNVGCGYRPISGWINLDLVPGFAEVVWDVREGLPFRDQSVDALFCEHVIEHLSREDGLRFIRECRRVLQVGGVVRISTPDAAKYLCSYVNNDEFLDHPRFGDGTVPRIDLVNRMMRENGHHLWIYDTRSLSIALDSAGFKNIQVMAYGLSSRPFMQGVDSKEREFESLYVEASR